MMHNWTKIITTKNEDEQNFQKNIQRILSMVDWEKISYFFNLSMNACGVQIDMECAPRGSYASFFLWLWSGCNGLGYHFQHLEKHSKDTYTRLIDFLLQIKIVFLLFKILIFLKYCVSQNWGDIWNKM